MPTFTYKARNNKGELRESSILAENTTQAKATLKQEGLWVIDIKQIDEKKSQINDTSKDSPAYAKMVDDYNSLIAQYNSLTETAKNMIIDYNNQVNKFNSCVVGK